MQKVTPEDLRFMRRALAAAEKGRGRVHPNPLVGAVVAARGKVLSVGAHEFFGGAHAEVNALRRLARVPSNASLYTTLEPCVHFGKTPPCVDLLLKKKVRRVVVAAKDPNPLMAGKGLRRLQKAGVKVVFGVLEGEAEALNRDFKRWITKKTPYVTVKIAQSLDGRSSTSTGESKWITGEESRRFAHELRLRADAVLVGVKTVLADDPRLSARLGGKPHHPVKIVLDAELRTPASARLFSGTPPARVFLFTSSRASAARRRALSRKARLYTVRETGRGYLDWKDVLRILGREGIVHVLVEGGREVLNSAFRAKIVNEAYFFTAPIVIGAEKRIAKALKFRRYERAGIGDDAVFHGVL